MSSEAITIRAAEVGDAELIAQLIHELAEYERMVAECNTSADQVRATLFTPEAKAYALIAQLGDQAAGFAVYFFNYSTFLGQYGIYLEDLYVRPDFRSQGLGLALLRRLAQLAQEHNCGRIEWSVLDWNSPAIDFYRSLGARQMKEWSTYRLSASAIAELAHTSN